MGKTIKSKSEERIPPPFFMGEVAPEASEGAAMVHLQMGLRGTIAYPLRPFRAPPP